MHTARAVLVLGLLALTAGCVSVGGDAAQTPPAFEDGVTVTVVDVVDGDTVDVRYSNGTTDTVRLLGIDTPEVRADNEPAEFEGVPDTEAGRDCLLEFGRDATGALENRIGGGEVTLVVDSTADRRDRYGRLLAYVEVDGTDLNRWLIAEGYARVYDSTFSRSADYYAAESKAQDAGAGVWNCRSNASATDQTRATGFAVASIHADADGNDHENLNDEYVVFENAGAESLDLSGWTVRDEAGYSYVFPSGTSLTPDATLTLRTGSGADTADTRYWGRDSAVWNNGGDTVTVTDANGSVVLSHEYP